MPTIDRVGTFLGTILESAYSVTSKGSFPQWVGKLLAEKKYVSELDEMKHFSITEPGYVDWNYDETIVAYLVMFTPDKGELQNAKQLTALGWAGDDFRTLSDLAGKKLLFRTEENNYNNTTTIKVGWIDTVDAPPERTLKSMDAATLKAMNAQYLGNKPKTPPKPATAVAAKPSVPAGKPAPAATATTSTSPAAATPTAPAVAQSVPTEVPKSVAAPATASPAAPASAAAAGKGKTTPPKKNAPPPPAAATSNPVPGLPTSTTKDEAWAYLFEPAVLGQNELAVVTDAWIAACSEVGENVDEKDFTGTMWADVRNKVLKDMDIKV